MSKNFIIGFNEKELNHFKSNFLSMIGKAGHLMGSNAPTKVIRVLKASKYS